MKFFITRSPHRAGICYCAPLATDNEQDLTPIYPQIFWITRFIGGHWFDLQP
ncbi:Hypothetical protein ETEE_1107 [Edwardsiella anguillarum ET080813]|uniref:Uncharacterized protein n=1 Tax=Edwardsiella anguillarum ET080813 TaxID=667120 RepID=A0A076LGC0_9GAMM|nr:Hypothetical protein ETEE_1107 [Edwardsiella anguillarum ET080813]